MSDSDSDSPQLSSDTLRALHEFYAQEALKDEKLKNIEKLSAGSIPIFDENWQLSQFWYDDVTCNVLSREALQVAGAEGNIALISCPSLYPTLKAASSNCNVTLFEYDQRFAAYGNEFILYDYKSPLDIPRDLAGSFDIVVADPPFLSDECLTKTAVTIKFLARDKILLCTGAVMENLADKLLGLKKSQFTPRHRNNLANEFCCFSNYKMDCINTS